MSFTEYMNDPIPRKIAIAVVLAQGLGSFAATHVAMKRMTKVLAGRDEAITILKESMNFLMDRADGHTLEELNEKLDYWRVVLEMPVENGEQ